MIDYSSLNLSQQRIVKHDSGPALVIAGPGSGKTHTLTYRVAYLIEYCHVAPWQIVLLTFTRKAAKEILGRVVELIGERALKVQGGTFHSFAAKTVYKYYKQLGYESLSPLGEGDAVALVKMLLQEEMSKLKQRYPHVEIKPPSARKFRALFSYTLNTEMAIESSVPLFPDFNDCQMLAIDGFYQYQARKREMNVIDYDDLLLLYRELLQKPEMQKRIAGRYQHIIVDEYQDTNTIQADIVFALASEHQNLIVVGDDCQSIYAFRGATIQNILQFCATYPQAQVYNLIENYRSTPSIVTVANTVIQHATEKIDKQLIAVRPSQDALPTLLKLPDQRSQAEWVKDTILSYIEHGTPLQEIAVLYRNSYHAHLLDIFLTAEGIPFEKIGGLRFQESAHIQDMLCFLCAFLNPNDDMSWRRMLMLLPGVGIKTAEKIRQTMQQCELQGDTVGTLLQRYPGKQKYVSAIHRLGKVFEKLDEVRIKESLDAIWEFYQPLFIEKFDASEHTFRQFGIQYLLTYAEQQENALSFLREFMLSEENTPERDEQEDKITLSTIHSAKGREWEIVFLIECINGALPMYNAENFEEERRLFYVALTRTKTHLIITYPEYISQGQDWRQTEPSPFLDGLPMLHREI